MASPTTRWWSTSAGPRWRTTSTGWSSGTRTAPRRRVQASMSEAHLRFTSQIAGPPEAIFDLVADLPNYGRWLPGSSSFARTVEVTPYPVRVGTTYLETGAIEKPGKVTEFDRPRHIGFQHTVQIRSPIHT